MSGGNANRAFGQALVSWLRQAGVRKFFLSPGARSSPIVAALRSEETVTHFDERGMAFAALGYARASGQAGVCFTTSGTAVANLHPAAVEAYYSEIPLLLITADRPPEMRGTGANQVIHQPGIFGPSVLGFHECPCPETTAEAAAGLEILARAWQQAHTPVRGPVHLNCPFQEPLLPDGAVDDVPLPPLPSLADCGQRTDLPEVSGRGLILVGQLDPAEQRESVAILDLAQRHGWPVFADPLSGLAGSRDPHVIANYDLALKARPESLRPDFVLHLGESLVSKSLGQWLASLREGTYYHISPSPRKRDAWKQGTVKWLMEIEEFCQALQAKPCRPEWLASWQEVSAIMERTLEELLPQRGEVSESGLARWLPGHLGNRPLFIGNSMPIRDTTSFARRSDATPVFFGNRGASGIDGNIATAAGISLAIGERVTVLLGDLATLHDLNSLALTKAQGVQLDLVVVNNGGGGIFRFLPLEVPPAQRETLWETPHAFSFANTARQFGLSYARLEAMEDLPALFTAKPPGAGSRLVEVVTDREVNHRQHQELMASIRQSLAPL